ncbi:MAG: tyrosine-type recombinase/integrase, partial [Deltaproteobacteria bacterium]
KWNQIRDGFIYLSETKTDEAREIPINDDLAEQIGNLKKRKAQNIDYVFCGRNPYHNINNSFRIALKKAKIKDFKFHDLWHTFASHFVIR